MLYYSIFILLAIIYDSEAAPDRNQIYCLISYLKENGLLSSNLPTMPFIGSPVKCLSKFEDNTDLLYIQINESLEKQYSNDTETPTCIMNELKLRNYAAYLLKEVAFESDEKLTATVGEEVVLENKNFYNNLIVEAVIKCEAKKESAKIFDQLFNNDDEDTKEDLESADCKRKYLVDNNLIDTTIYKVVLNDTNVDTDCTTIIKNTFREAEMSMHADLQSGEDGMTTNQADCTLEKYRSKNYNDLILAIAELSKFNPTQAQIDVYREKFLKMMLELSFELVKCL